MSNPGFTLSLPFPDNSLPPRRFRCFDQSRQFVKYYGRAILGKIKKSIEDEGQGVLYGTIGSGKSHLLLALACYYIRKGERVLFFPEVRNMQRLNCWREKVFFLLQQERKRESPNPAFTEAFNKILNLKEDGGRSILFVVLDILWEYRNLLDNVLVIDQWDTITTKYSEDKLDDLETMLLEIGKLRIFATSANDKLQQQRFYIDKNDKRNFIDNFSGLNPQEFNIWLQSNNFRLRGNHDHLAPLNEGELHMLADYTGCVPLYLEYVAAAKEDIPEGSEDTIEARIEVISRKYVSSMVKEINKFYRTHDKSVKDAQYIDDAFACIFRIRVSDDFEKTVFFRYFDVDQNENGKCCCGFAQRALRNAVTFNLSQPQFDAGKFLEKLEIEDNISQLGFLLETIVLKNIENSGIYALNLQRPTHILKILDYQNIIPAKKDELKYYKGDFNFASVDCIIVTESTITGVYITISKKHKDISKKFYENLQNTKLNLEEYLIRICWLVPADYVSTFRNRILQKELNTPLNYEVLIIDSLVESVLKRNQRYRKITSTRNFSIDTADIMKAPTLTSPAVSSTLGGGNIISKRVREFKINNSESKKEKLLDRY